MLQRLKNRFAGAGVAVALAGLPAGALAQSAGTSGVAAGAALYNADCAVCHQPSGAGGIHFGDAVSADLRAPGLEQTYHGSDALILRAILQAKDETGAPLDLPMPAWSGRLTAAQADEIIKYLHTLRG